MTITRLDKYYVHGNPEVERPLIDREIRPIGEEDTQHPRASLFLPSPSEGPSVFTGSDIKARGLHVTSEGPACLSPKNPRPGIVTWGFPMRLLPRTGITLCRALQNVNPGMDAIIDKQNILRRQPVCVVFVLVPGNDSPCLKQDRNNAAFHSWLLLRRILLYACLTSSAGAVEAMELFSITLTCGLHITRMNTHTAVR